MFTSLKNKIREETGSDLSKFTAKITSSTVQKIESLRGKSHQGSTSSLNSIVSSDGFKEDGQIDQEEFRKRLAKIENDFGRKLEQKENEWREILADKEKQLQAVQKEKEEAFKQVLTLKENLQISEVTKKKVLKHQENSEHMESLQTQELAKVKHLVLLREQELSEKVSALKEANSQLEKLRNEVNRLRRQEEHLSDVQDDLESLRHSTARDLASLASDLARCEEDRRHLTDLVAILRQRVSNETSNDEATIKERKLLEQRLEAAHLQLADIKTSWSDKITALETQVGRLSRQAAEEGAERRRAVEEKDKLLETVRQLEAELECSRFEMNNKDNKIQRLSDDVKELSNEVKILRSEKEEEIAFLRAELGNASNDLSKAKKQLELSENELEKNEEEFGKLKISVDSEHQANESLRQVITKLEKELGDEKANSLNVQRTLTRVISEKNTALLRNAEVSQQIELVKQNMRRQERDFKDAMAKLSQLEEENSKLKEDQETQHSLKNSVVQLEDQIAEKNKTIKTLQLRLADMKKTLQQELRTPGNPNYHTDLMDGNSAAILAPSHISTKHFPSAVKRDEDDVNFKYLKHVIIKFLVSREYEAQHLIKAIATLLKFTPEEEKLIQDTLEWKKSWFGSRPKIGHHNSKYSNS